MLRPDFVDLVAYAVEQRVGVKFSTNGTRHHRPRGRQLAALDYLDVQVSLDGADAGTNDLMRGEAPTRRPAAPWTTWPRRASVRSRSGWW